MVGQCREGRRERQLDGWEAIGQYACIHIHIYYWVDCGYISFPLPDALLRLDLFVG